MFRGLMMSQKAEGEHGEWAGKSKDFRGKLSRPR